MTPTFRPCRCDRNVFFSGPSSSGNRCRLLGGGLVEMRKRRPHRAFRNLRRTRTSQILLRSHLLSASPSFGRHRKLSRTASARSLRRRRVLPVMTAPAIAKTRIAQRLTAALFLSKRNNAWKAREEKKKERVRLPLRCYRRARRRRR